jgi:hypothetical protein
MEMKLYQLSGQYAQLMEMIDNEELTIDQIKETLESFEDAISVKAENIVKLIKSIEAEAEMFKTEKDKLAQKQKARENKAEWLHTYLESSLKGAGIKKLDAGLYKLAFQKSSPSVKIVDESLIPEKFKTPQPAKISKDDIKKAIKNGEDVKGATLVEDNEHLRIR